MRFTLLDRIVCLEPGARITAVKSLSAAEEYLADHFPIFPVMPGVLMLEAMTQAGAWLIRASEDFAHGLIVLKEARNVKYSQFVSPGQTLTVKAEITSHGERETKLKAEGTVDGELRVSARLVLERFDLVAEGLGSRAADMHMKREQRRLFAVLSGPPAAEPAEALAAGYNEPIGQIGFGGRQTAQEVSRNALA